MISANFNKAPYKIFHFPALFPSLSAFATTNLSVTFFAELITAIFLIQSIKPNICNGADLPNLTHTLPTKMI